jgi:hypothetical protein
VWWQWKNIGEGKSHLGGIRFNCPLANSALSQGKGKWERDGNFCLMVNLVPENLCLKRML